MDNPASFNRVVVRVSFRQSKPDPFADERMNCEGDPILFMSEALQQRQRFQFSDDVIEVNI